MNRSKLKTLLVLSAGAIALAACGGGSDIASPGEGSTGGSGGGTGGGGTGGTGGAAADCPTGFTNVGTISSPTVTYRNCQLPSQISGSFNVPLRAGTIYSISGRTAVGIDLGADPSAPLAGGAAATLSIDAGVRIFASSGNDYLIVNRGSQIFAEGTAANPIVFTSRQNVIGTTNENSMGQWGGIVIAGRAPQANCVLTASPVTCTGQVEGTSAFYGGNTGADNSGRMRYVQIKYSGFEISTGNELQALTLAGVGSGTTIEYVQSYNSSDDGIEIFGGNVNLRYIVINGADDDGFDTDTGWRGGAQFGIVTQRQPATTSRSAGFEFSAAPTSVPIATRYNSQPKISNWTIIGRSPADQQHTIVHLDTGTKATIINSVFTNAAGTVAGCLDIADADTAGVSPVFNSVFFSCAAPYRAANSARSQGVFTAGTNNTPTGTSTLTAPSGTSITNQTLTFVNGANENAVTPANAPAAHPFFQAVAYIGAVRNSADTWWQGWTCGLTSGQTC